MVIQIYLDLRKTYGIDAYTCIVFPPHIYS